MKLWYTWYTSAVILWQWQSFLAPVQFLYWQPSSSCLMQRCYMQSLLQSSSLFSTTHTRMQWFGSMMQMCPWHRTSFMLCYHCSFCFLFIPYTLLLLLGQWLLPKSHLCLLSWVRNQTLKAILDTYHAPYKPKHRYWTGLLLLVCNALFLVFAFNISGNDSVNLLVISPTAFGIFIWFALSWKVYKSWCLNALGLSFILNLGMLAAATYHVTLSGVSQAAVAYTSVVIAFLSFLRIVTYHIYMWIKSNINGRIISYSTKMKVPRKM